MKLGPSADEPDECPTCNNARTPRRRYPGRVCGPCPECGLDRPVSDWAFTEGFL